jgi:hypothetical protein
VYGAGAIRGIQPALSLDTANQLFYRMRQFNVNIRNNIFMRSTQRMVKTMSGASQPRRQGWLTSARAVSTLGQLKLKTVKSGNMAVVVGLMDW